MPDSKSIQISIYKHQLCHPTKHATTTNKPLHSEHPTTTTTTPHPPPWRGAVGRGQHVHRVGLPSPQTPPPPPPTPIHPPLLRLHGAHGPGRVPQLRGLRHRAGVAGRGDGPRRSRNGRTHDAGDLRRGARRRRHGGRGGQRAMERW